MVLLFAWSAINPRAPLLRECWLVLEGITCQAIEDKDRKEMSGLAGRIETDGKEEGQESIRLLIS